MTASAISRYNLGSATQVPVPSQSHYVRRDSLLIFLGAVIVFVFGPVPEFIGFQARFGLFAQEMFRHGPTFFPTTYGRPYPDYPATSTFLVYLVSLLFGRVTPLTTILPTAVVSALILVVTYRIGAMRSRRWGLAAVLFALLTVEFLSGSRVAALDQYVSLMVTLSFYVVYSADYLDRRKRLWLLAPIGVLGFAFRGPLGLALPAAVVCSYYLRDRRWKVLAVTAISAGILMAFCLAGLLAAARAQGGDTLAEMVLDMQMTGRMSDRGEGVTYYWLRGFTSYALAYPLAIVVVISRFKDILRRDRDADARLLGGLVAWTLIVLACLSIPTAKKTRYILPVAPAISLLASYLVVETSPKGLLLGTKRLLLQFCCWFPVAAAVVAPIILLFARRIEPAWPARYLGAFALLALLAVLAARCHRRWADQPQNELAALATAAAAFVVLYIGVIDPIRYGAERTRPFVRQVETLCEEDPGTLVFFRVGPDGEDIKFMANLSGTVEPRFLDSLDAIHGLPGKSYVIMREQAFRSMPADERKQMRLLVRGKIGHADFVAATLETSQSG